MTTDKCPSIQRSWDGSHGAGSAEARAAEPAPAAVGSTSTGADGVGRGSDVAAAGDDTGASEVAAAQTSEVESSGRPAAPAARPAPKPEQTSDDTDVGWGETPESGDAHDRWLLEQRPPHWD